VVPTATHEVALGQLTLSNVSLSAPLHVGSEVGLQDHSPFDNVPIEYAASRDPSSPTATHWAVVGQSTPARDSAPLT
jgi:hypothetical protein